MRTRWGTLLVLGIALLAGACATSATQTGQRIDDGMTTAAVKAKLAEDRLGTLTEVGVDTYQGDVTLTGTVKDEFLRQRAGELARQVKGVRTVTNNILTRSAEAVVTAPPPVAAPVPAPPVNGTDGTWRTVDQTFGGSTEDIRARAAREAAIENRSVAYERQDGSQRVEASPLPSPLSLPGKTGCRWVQQRVYENGQLVDERSTEICS
jgi:hypothetical protein